MSRGTVYIETSIVSYLAGCPSGNLLIAACQQATRVWWENRRSQYELYTSQLVVEEAGRGDREMAAKRLDYLAGVPELQATSEVQYLARALGARPAAAEVGGRRTSHSDCCRAWHRLVANLELPAHRQSSNKTTSSFSMRSGRICVSRDMHSYRSARGDRR